MPEPEKISTLIHEFSSYGQTFHSYFLLIQNPSFSLSHKKLCEILDRCSKRCLEARQTLLENIKDE